MAAPIYNREECSSIILAELIKGEPLTRICKASDALPAASTFLLWCDEDKALAEQYARASQLGYDAKAEAALHAAETAEDAAKGRLAFDAARWWLGKRAPKRYGEKLEVGGPGENGEHIVKVARIELVPVAPDDNG